MHRRHTCGEHEATRGGVCTVLMLQKGTWYKAPYSLVIFAAAALTSMLRVSGNTSTSTGRAPSCTRGARVVLHASAGTSTSSPRRKPSTPRPSLPMPESSIAPATAIRLADEPELTMTAHGTLKYFYRCLSKRSTRAPMVSLPESIVSAIAMSSAASRVSEARGNREAAPVWIAACLRARNSSISAVAHAS